MMGSVGGMRLAHAVRPPTIIVVTAHIWNRLAMGLILLEALVALLLLLLLVWWTMFSGRQRGELPRKKDQDQPPRDAP